MLHQDNIGTTYVGTSNLRMEPITFVPLYFVAMPQFIIIITKALFVSTPINIVVGLKSRPQTPKGTKFVNLCEDMPQEVKGVFASQPSN